MLPQLLWHLLPQPHLPHCFLMPWHSMKLSSSEVVINRVRQPCTNYEVLSNYNWTSPERNNPYQEVAAGPSGIENGYNTETPHEGNTFLFVFVKILNTGKDAIYAPSANQFVVYSNGAAYNQSSIPTSGVTINQVSGTQFVDLTGPAEPLGLSDRVKVTRWMVISFTRFQVLFLLMLPT